MPVDLKKIISILSLLSLLSLLGCLKNPSLINSSMGTVDTIPSTFENPVDQPAGEVSPDIKSEPPPQHQQPNPTLKPSNPKTGQQEIILEIPEASPFIKDAEWVMVHEGKKIGTPCNLYLLRVLEVAGFPNDDFLANDFDIYAKKYFKSYKAVDFKNDGLGSEIARLKNHLWSYPERMPFIMQWSRSGVRGHIAILERIHDRLIIYQASLNKYTARKDQTTVQSLLSGFNRRTLTVYSEFKK